jgi:hypothetical protein
MIMCLFDDQDASIVWTKQRTKSSYYSTAIYLQYPAIQALGDSSLATGTQ